MNIEISYNKINGIARAIWLNTSGGVSIAATINMKTTITLLLFINSTDVISSKIDKI